MGPRYFAYGSNLTVSRMQERVPSATPLGVAHLERHRLAWDKLGADGTGKANLARCEDAIVWGVVYGLDPGAWSTLDRFEPGYERISVTVSLAGDLVGCTTYLAPGHPDVAAPHGWYQDLVIEGARAHGLPADYLRALERIRGEGP